MKRLFLSIILFVFFGMTQHAFGTVTIGGVSTFDAGKSSILINGTSSPLTFNTLSTTSSGLQIQSASTDPLNTYQFSSATNPSPTIQLTSLSTYETDFTRISTVSDLVGSVTSVTPIQTLKLDGSTGSFSVNNGVSTFTSNAATLIQEIFSTVGGTPASGGGGGPSSPLTSLDLANSPVLTFTFNADDLKLGQIKNETIDVTWHTSDNVQFNDYSLGLINNGLTLQFTPQPPYILNGDPSGNSHGKLFFMVKTPSQYCTNTIHADCLDPNVGRSDIPLTIETISNEKVIRQSVVLSFTFSKNQDVASYTVFAMVGVGIGGMTLAGVVHSKKGIFKKKTKKKLEKKPKKITKDKQLEKDAKKRIETIKKIEKDSKHLLPKKFKKL